MASREVYRIDIPIEAEDRYSDEFKKAEKGIEKVKKTAKNMGDDVSGGLRNAGKAADRATGQVTKFQKSMDGTQKRLQGMSRKRYDLMIRAKDNASRVISGINRHVQRVASRSYSFTVRALDSATRVLGGIRRSILSIPSVITVALAYVGVKNAGEATLGAAMDFERYQVSMEHWLKGNTKQAEELIGWMGRFADATPFNSSDLFPALSRAIGVTGGDVKKAQDLLKTSTDMAAIMPGKTVSDAMEAIADARMGEFERLKEFGLKFTKDDFDKVGFNGLMREMEKQFGGAAKRFSGTTWGVLSTLDGYRSALLRMFGEGFLDPMKPRLDAISNWLDKNQDTWKRWKNTMKKNGEEASEWLFSRLETGFNYVRTRYLDNPEFMKLDFESKVDFVMGDIQQWWSSKGRPALDGWWESTGKPWAAKTGQFIGEAIFEGIVIGVKGGLGTLWEMIKNTVSNPTVGNIGGTAAAGFAGAGLASMILAPMLTTGKMVFDAGRWVWNHTGGRNKGDGKGKSSMPQPKNTPAQTTTTKPSNGNRPVILGSDGRPLPPSGSAPSSQPTSTPKPSKVPKMPDWLGKTGKRIPYIGAALALLDIFSAPTTQEKAGAVGGAGGALAGGIMGAKGGALIGSVFPGVGTAVGGIIGGLGGSIIGGIGGEKLMEWIFGPKASEPVAPAAAAALQNDVSASGGMGVDPSSFQAEMGIVKANISRLADWLGQASGWVAGAFQPLQGATNVLRNNISLLTSYVGQASGQIVGAFMPISQYGAMLNQNMSVLTMYLGQASGFVVGAYFPLAGSGLLLNHNTTVLAGYLGQSSGMVVGAFFPLAGVGPLLTQNASALAMNLAMASGWVASLHGIQTGAAQVKAALSGLAARINSTPAPSMSGVTTSAGRRPVAYANGGVINRPHLGLVGEAGPEAIIPLSAGRRSRALDLYRQTGRMLGVRQYSEGGIVSAPAVASGSSGGVSVSLGGLHVGSIVVHAEGADAESVSDNMVEKIALKLADKLRGAFSGLVITAD